MGAVTNGIVYLDLGLDLHTLPQHLLPYVPLFGRALTEIGTERENFVKLSQRIGRNTGDLRTQRFVSSTRRGTKSTAWLFLRGKAMPEQTSDLLAIMTDMLLTVKLDNRERFWQMALEEKSRLESSLVPSGHSYADMRARFSEADWANEQTGGIAYRSAISRRPPRTRSMEREGHFAASNLQNRPDRVVGCMALLGAREWDRQTGWFLGNERLRRMYRVRHPSLLVSHCGCTR